MGSGAIAREVCGTAFCSGCDRRVLYYLSFSVSIGWQRGLRERSEHAKASDRSSWILSRREGRFGKRAKDEVVLLRPAMPAAEQ